MAETPITPVPLHQLVIEKKPSQAESLESLGKANLLNPLVAQTTPISSKDIKDLSDQNVNFVTPEKTWDIQKAENQGNLEQLYNLSKQVVVGHGVGGTIAGIGYLGNLVQGASIANNYDNSFSNEVTNIGNAILESTQTNNPIWEEQQGKFNPGDFGYWMGRFADMGSMLSMLIPTYGVIKAAGALAKGLTLSSQLAKVANTTRLGAQTANWMVKGISSAIVSRQIEASMEADAIYQEQYNKYKDLGFSELEAKTTASKAAASTYRGNWAMLAQDIPQYLMLGSKWNPSATKATSTGIKGIVGGTKAYVKDAFWEGVEEGYQYILGQESKAQSDIDNGLASADFGRSYRIKKDVQDGEFLNSVISGMFGSAVMQGGNTVAAKIFNKQQAQQEDIYNTEKAANAISYADKYKDLNQRIRQADLTEDKESARQFRRELSTELALQASDLGNINKHTEFLEGLNAMTPEQMDAFNVNNGTEYNQEFKEILPILIEDSKKIGELYNEGFRRFGDKNLANTYAKAKFDLDTKDITRRGLDGEIARLSADVPLLSDLSPAGVIQATAINTINSNKELIKVLKKAKESGNITGKRLEALEDNILKAEESIDKANKDIQDSKLIELTPDQKRSDKSIIDSYDKTNKELNSNLVRRASLDMDLKVAIDTINKLNNNPGKIQENKINISIDKAETIEQLEAIAATLPIDTYESTKEAYRAKLESKYTELKQEEDNIKRDIIEKEVSVVQPTNPSIETPIVVQANNFKVDPDSDFNDLLIKQGKPINPLNLKNGDITSVEDPHEYGAIVFGEFNNGVINPDFIFWKADQVYFKKINNEWTFEGDPIVDPDYLEAIENSLDDIHDDFITEGKQFYHTQIFTAKQREEILQLVNPSESTITKENSTDTEVIAIEEFTIEQTEENTYLKPNLPGNRVAYKSYRGNNPTTDLSEGFKKEFTDLIETPIPFSEKFEEDIILSIDLDYMKSNPSLNKLISQLDTLQDIGNIPVKVEFKGKDGKTYTSYLYTSNTLRQQGYNTQEQIDNLLSLKRSVVDAYNQGTTVITKIDYTASVLGGVFAKQLESFENVPSSFQLPIEEFDLRVSSDNYYIKADGTEDFDLPSPKKKGNIYSVHRNANGKNVPVKLWNSKITPIIANLILNTYREINSKGRNKILSSEFKEANKSDILNNLINVLDNPTYGTLLENLVYEGKKETATAKYPLYLTEGKLTYGGITEDIKNINTEAFINYTTTNKYFQVNRKLLADNKYKKFLFDNNILKTNNAAVDGNLFIQPTIVLSTDTTQRVVIPVKTEAISVPDESKPTTIVREDLEAPSIFDSKDIAPTKATIINETEAIAWLRSNLSMVPVELQDDAIEIFKDGTQSIGRFTEGMIILSRKANSGTEYHEAFHAVSQLYLSEKERGSLYNKVRTVEGKQVSDREAEELLADEFAYYVKTNGEADYKYVNKSSPSSFFGKLLQWIKSVFSNTTTVDKIFKNINSGFYTNKVLPQDLKVTSYDKRVDNLSVEQTKNITDHLLYLAFATQDLGAQDISKLDFNKAVFELFKVYNIADSSFKERYERVFDSLCRSDWRTIFNNPKINLKEVEWIDNYSPLATNLYEGLQTLGIKTKITKKTAEELLDDVRLDEDDTDNYTPLTTKASYNYSNKETSRNNTKLLVANLPAIKEIKDGKNIYEKDDYFGLVKIADYGSTWSFLEDLLSNINPTNEQDGLDIMMNRIKDSLTFRPELSKLYNNLSSASEEVRTQFYTDMNLVKNNFATTLLTKTYDSSTKKYNYEYKFQKGNQKNIANRITSEWSDLFNNNFLTDSGIDVSKVIEITNELSVIENKLKERSLSESELNSIINNIYNTLNKLGFKFTSVNSLNYVINSIKSNNLQGKISAFLLSKDVGINKAIERIALGQDPTTVLSDEKGITYIVNLEAKFRKDGFESSIVGAGGNKQWSYSYGNFFNKVISSMNNINESDFIKNLSNTPYFKNSVWYHQLKTNQVSAANITSSIFSSLKEESNGDSGSSLTDLAPNEEKSDIINRIIANIDSSDRSSYSTGLAKADKSTDVLISGFKLIPAKYNNNQLSNAGINILSGYLIDELNRTIQAHKDIDIWKENNNTSDLVEYYHYDPKTKDKFDKSGGAFRMFLFPELSPKLLKESNKELYNVIYDESGVPFPISDNFIKNSLVRDYINTSFRKALNFEITEALKVGVIKQGAELENVSLDNKLVSKRKETMSEQEAVISLFADYTLNGIINNVETTKFFHGDPAFYKGTVVDPFADIKKRTPLILATGRAQRVYRDKENNWVVPPVYKSAVLDDSEIASYYYTPEYIDNLASIYSELNGTSKETELSKLTEQFSAYKKVNETDAQAYITLDRYRVTQLGWGKWTTAKQEAFDAIKTWESNPTTENLNLARRLSKESDLAMQPLKSVHTGMEFHSSNPGIGIIEYNKQSEAVLNPVFTIGTPLDKLRVSMEGTVDHVIFRSGKKVGTQGSTSISINGDINSNIKFNKIKNLSSYNYYLQQDLPYHGFDESLEGSQIFNVVQSDVDINHTYSNGMTGKELVTALQTTQGKLHNIGGQELKDKYSFDTDWTEDNYKKLRKDIMEDLTKRGASDNIRETLQDTSIPFSAIPQAFKRVTNAFNSMVNSSGVKLKMPGGPLIQISGFGIARPTGYTELDKKTKEGILWFGEKELSPPKLIKTEEGITSLKGQILVPHTIVESIEGWENMSKTELLSKIDKDTLYAIGYRIPNQGLSSNDSLEIVGILPVEAGDSVVLYNEVTTKTGADFDIDKMYIMVPNYNYNKESGRIEKVKYDPANETKEGLQNYKLDLYSTLLSDPKSYLSVVAPLDSPFLSDTINELHGIDKVENRDLIFMSAGQQYNIKTSFRGGKTGIGILANNIVDHVQGQIFDLKLNGIDLGRGNRSVEGETIFSGLNCEPTQDGTVYKISSVLSWFANAFVDIAKDPYITKGNFNDTTLSTTMMLVRAGFAPDWIINFMGQPILKDYVTLTNANKGRIKSYNDVITSVKNKYSGDAKTISANIGITTLRKNIQGEVDNGVQLGILDLFLDFDKSAKVLQEQIRASKQNTNGAGKSNIEAFTISEQVNKVNSENKIGNFNNKFKGALGAAYDNSITLLRNMFGGFLFSDNSVNRQAVREISSDQGKLFATDLELNEKVSSSFYSYVSSGLEFFKNTDLKELVYGKSSIANRIYDLKYHKDSPVRNNILIQYLEVQKQKGSIPGTVGINQFRDKSVVVQNQITQSWEELLQSDNPKIRSVAEDLVKYAFYSSGFNPTSKSFFEYIPYKYLKQIGFGDYMDSFMKDPNNQVIDNFKEQFYQNNIDSDYIKDFNKNDVTINKGILTIKEDSLKKFFIGFSTVNNATQTEYSRYVKFEGKLYKLQGYDSNNTPIYTQIGIKGYASKDGNRIVEYSFNENKQSIFNPLVKEIQVEVSLYPQIPNSESYTNASEDQLTKVDNTNPEIVEEVKEETEEKEVSLDNVKHRFETEDDAIFSLDKLKIKTGDVIEINKELFIVKNEENEDLDFTPISKKESIDPENDLICE